MQGLQLAQLSPHCSGQLSHLLNALALPPAHQGMTTQAIIWYPKSLCSVVSYSALLY